MTPNRGSASLRVPVALGVLTLLFFANQRLTMPRLKRFVLDATAGESMDSIQTRALAIVRDNLGDLFTPLDLALILGIAIVLVYLAHAELRDRALGRALDDATRSHLVLASLLLPLCLIMTRFYLDPGRVLLGDAVVHTIRATMVAEHLRNLSPPVWQFYWYGGIPLLEYYAPLFMVLTGVLSLLSNDIDTATKIVLFATHVGSVVAMFAFLNEACRDRVGALVGALAYGLCFHRTHIVLYRGDLQLSMVFLLYPLTFWVAERFFRDPRRPRRIFLLLTGLLSLLILTHQGYGFFAIIFLGVFTVARTLLSFESLRDRVVVLGFFGLAVGSALLVAAFLLVPFMLDTEYIHGMPGMPFRILIPSPRAVIVLVSLLWWKLGTSGNIGYAGVSIFAASVAASVYAFRKRLATPIALTIAGLVAISMTRNFVHYNVKNASFFVFFMTALTAWSPIALAAALSRLTRLRAIASRLGEYFPLRVAVLLLAAFFVDLGAMTFHSPYRDDPDFKEPVYERVRSLGEDYKVLERQLLKYEPGIDQRDVFEPNRLGTVVAFSRVHSPMGWFHEGAGKSFGYNAEITKQVQLDLHENRLSEESLTGLYLMGVKYLLFRDRQHFYIPPLEGPEPLRFRDEILVLDRATPVIVSDRVVSAAEVEGYDPANIIERSLYFDSETYDYSGALYREVVLPLVETMNVARDRGTAEALIAHGIDLRHEPEPGTPLTSRVKDLEVDIDSLSFEYETNRQAFGRLAYSYFPFLDVRIDGSPAAFHRSAMNHILLPMPAGRHEVTIEGRASRIRVWSFYFSVAALLALAAVPGRWFGVFELDRSIA